MTTMEEYLEKAILVCTLRLSIAEKHNEIYNKMVKKLNNTFWFPLFHPFRYDRKKWKYMDGARETFQSCLFFKHYKEAYEFIIEKSKENA